MKNYRKVMAALVLALLLSTPVFAGVIHTGEGEAPPPPPPANGEMHTGATNGVIQTGEAEATPEATNAVTEITLNLLHSVLSLF
jgi:hypothetical protein